MIECELGTANCELAVWGLRKARKSAVEARWRSGDVEDCKSAAVPASRPIVRTIHALFYPPDSVGFRCHCELSPYFPRRSSSRSTASRTNLARGSPLRAASILASKSLPNRIGVGFVSEAFSSSGNRPIRRVLSGTAFLAKSVIFPIPPIAQQSDTGYISDIGFGGKAMHADTNYKELKPACDKAPDGQRCTLGSPHDGQCASVREGASRNEQFLSFMCSCGAGFNTAEERDRHTARWCSPHSPSLLAGNLKSQPAASTDAQAWQTIETVDRYGQPSLDLYDPEHASEYGVSWDGYWNDADGTDHPETGGHWVAAVWCNSCSEWHATRINPTHWRLRPTAPEPA